MLERFTADHAQEGSQDEVGTGAPFEVELRQSGVTLQVPADRTLLSVVLDVVDSVPYSCEDGYCGSCETRVLEGIPDHRDIILSAEEHAANNTMMICVGRSKSARLVLDLLSCLNPALTCLDSAALDRSAKAYLRAMFGPEASHPIPSLEGAAHAGFGPVTAPSHSPIERIPLPVKNIARISSCSSGCSHCGQCAASAML